MSFNSLWKMFLSEYAKEAVTNILQGHTVTDILQKPLVEFKESKQFKDLVERQISEYVKQQLPLIYKSDCRARDKKNHWRLNCGAGFKLFFLQVS